jgi:peptidoglycan/LPS O-acetylase OafA/YrhL
VIESTEAPSRACALGATERIGAIEGLRAVAVAGVIAFHFGIGVPGGFLGVDLFFVISGYVITRLLLIEWQRAGSIDWLRFWARRARRLLPAVLKVTRSLRVLAAVAGVGAVISYGAMAVLFGPHGVDRAYLGTDTRSGALLLGVLCALALTRSTPGPDGSWDRRVPGRGVSALALVFCSAVFIQPRPPAEQDSGVTVHGHP